MLTVVLTHRCRLNPVDQSRPCDVWHAHHAPDKGDAGPPRTKNLRAVQLFPGQSKLETTVRYLSTEVDNALEVAEQTET